MRKVMIGASLILAGCQFWPWVVGHNVGVKIGAAQAAAPAPRLIQAVAMTPRASAFAPAETTVAVPMTCYQQYRLKFDRCAAADQACHLQTADQWDLCEAKGVWPS